MNGLSKKNSYQHTTVLGSATLVLVSTYGLLVVSIKMNELFESFEPMNS